MPDLPPWAQQLVTLYESGAHCQFVLHGNVSDTFLIPSAPAGGVRSGDLDSYLTDVLLPPFEVVLFYDLGSGVRVSKGQAHLDDWPSFSKYGGLPRRPREAVAFIDHFLRYCANLEAFAGRRVRVAVVLKGASMIVPAVGGVLNHDLSAMAVQVRGWSSEPKLTDGGIATFLVTENLNDLHPILVNNVRAAHLEVPLPRATEIADALGVWRALYPVALGNFDDLTQPSAQLSGATLGSLAALLKQREHLEFPLVDDDLADLKKELVEKECSGLIEFIESDLTLDAVHGQAAIKEWLRQDIALWRKGDLQAIPMGYLFCGPVGTGKTFLVKCLAGEAGIPVVKLKNFRDRWVGSTESNLEKIFRLLHALGRCIVFIDEADQALGRRASSGNDSGISGRVYSMIAEEMSQTTNRGRILWILASSRPDLIEVDLKRPGRVDVKIPIFPAANSDESLALIRALCGKFGLELPPDIGDNLAGLVPRMMTAGAAEALAMKVYRIVRTEGSTTVDALRSCLQDYQNPVPKDVMDFQIEIAVNEATDLGFVPEPFRS